MKNLIIILIFLNPIWIFSQSLFSKEELITATEGGDKWYKDIKNKFPSWNLEVAFIGKDHKNGESITITGHVIHPTETEVVDIDNLKGHSKKDVGKVMPKRYVLDFFLRTEQGKYPEIFDNYWKDRPYEKGKGYKAFKRWQWFAEPKVFP